MSTSRTIQAQSIILNSLKKIYLDASQINAEKSSLIVRDIVLTNNPRQKQAITVKTYSDLQLSETELLNGLIVFNPVGNDVSYTYNLYQNPYMVDNTIFYNAGYNVPGTNDPDGDITNAANIVNVVLPTSYTQLNVGESLEITIVNNGNSALRLAETANEKTVGFDLVYDATSAKFIVKRETNTLTYFIRSA